MYTDSRFTEAFLAQLYSAHRVLHAVAHPVRLDILTLLDRRGSLNVQDLADLAELDRTATSHHLRLLLQTNCVERKREGSYLIYSVNHARISRLAAGIAALRPVAPEAATVLSEE